MTKSIAIVVCGATATGKSAYAFKLAKNYPRSTIISVDSRQFYKYLPTITGQDNQKLLPTGATLFGQNFLEPNQISNVGDFKRYAEPLIKNSLANKIPLILVGGTGLYLKALTQNLENISVPPDNEFRKKAEKLSVEELQNILRKENTTVFNSLNYSDVNNPRRLIRHIEISRDPLKSSIYDLQSTISYTWIGLRKSPEKLQELIQKRVISRIKNGAINEVKFLLKNYPDTSLPIYSTLGVTEIITYINKKIDREELIKQWTIKDYAYAKRQILWFSKQPDIVWYD